MGRGQEHKGGGSRAHDVHEPWGWGGERPMLGMKNNALVIKKKKQWALSSWVSGRNILVLRRGGDDFLFWVLKYDEKVTRGAWGKNAPRGGNSSSEGTEAWKSSRSGMQAFRCSRELMRHG